MRIELVLKARLTISFAVRLHRQRRNPQRQHRRATAARVGRPTTSICVRGRGIWAICPYRAGSIEGDNRLLKKAIGVQLGEEDEGHIKFVNTRCNTLRLCFQPAPIKSHHRNRSPELGHDDCGGTA
jgi:hypothetical protein